MFFPGTAGRGVLSSTDGVTLASSGPPDARVSALFQAAGGRVFAGTALGIEHSNDEGAHWIGASLDSGYIACFEAQGSTLFVGTLHPTGLYRSLDGGDTWTPVTTLANHQDVADLTGARRAQLRRRARSGR